MKLQLVITFVSIKCCYPAHIYLLKFNNKNTRKRCEIYSKLTIKTPENVIDIILVLIKLTLNKFQLGIYMQMSINKQITYKDALKTFSNFKNKQKSV